MVAFFQSYGILILVGIILAGLFIWVSRSPVQHHTSQDSDTGNPDDIKHLPVASIVKRKGAKDE